MKEEPIEIGVSDDDEVDEGCICQRWPMLVLALSFFVFGAIGIIVSYAMLRDKSLEHKHHYGVVFDAGSTHTDITIYKWPSDVKYQGTASVHQVQYSVCSDIGVSKFLNNPSGAGTLIEKCMEDVALPNVPKHSRPHTPVYVGATAGMRLLCARNMTSCQEIKNTIGKSLKKYKFLLVNDSVKVLSGKAEGTFGWISVNLLKRRISEKMRSYDRSTYGTLDLGGGSAEISFIPKAGTKIPDDYRSELRLYGNNFSLYTHSYLCYGMKEAERRLLASLVQESGYASEIKNPCYARGYEYNETAKELWLEPCSMKPVSSIFPLNDSKSYTFTGTSEPKNCAKVVRRLFNETTCNFGQCSFDGVYQPNLIGRFVAFAGFGHLAEFLNLTEDDSVESMGKAAEEFCQKTWQMMKEENPSVPLKFLPKNCFNAVYIYQILTHGFHFEKKSNKVEFRTEIRGHDISWSLGFMVNASNLIPVEEAKSRLGKQDFMLFSSLSVVVISFGILLCFCYAIKKCRNRIGEYQSLPHS